MSVIRDVNEVRAIKNLPPVPGGDKLYFSTASQKPAKPPEAQPDEPDPTVQE